MSVSTSLLPANARTGVGTAVHGGAARELDRVHDHVLRLLGDEQAAARVVADVAARAAARAEELGEAPTFQRLVRLAHARMAVSERRQPDDGLVARLAGDQEPAGPMLVRAMATAGRRGAALLDLTTRHDVDLERAASLIGAERATAARSRTEALRQVRAHLAENGRALAVTAILARLPVAGAPTHVHQLLDLPDPTDVAVRVPAPLAWLGTTATVLLTLAGVTMGLPRLVAADAAGDAPVAVGQLVTDGPAVRQLATPGDDVPEGGVEQLVVNEPAQGPVAPASPEPTSASPEPEPTVEPSPTDEPSPPPDDDPGDDEPSPEPSPDPTRDPLGILPTGP